MRVSLIIPPSGFLLDDRVFPALGILKVAAVLEQAGVDVSVLDLCGVSDVQSAVAKFLAGPDADAYGLTATMPQMPAAAAIALQVKETKPGAKVMLGGPHVTLMNASARQEQQRGEPSRACKAIDELIERFDVLVCGDGERTIGLALREDAPSLIDADDQKSELFLTKTDLDASPFSSRHLIDLMSYHYAVDGVRATSMIAQLGCPFGCHFCGGRRSPFLRKIRTRSTSTVISEMWHLYEHYGMRGFMFLDDELNVNKSFMELLSEMQRLQDALGVEFRMRGFLKAELITAPMAAEMYKAGFRQVLVGFESGHERILKNIHKQATRDDNTRAVETLHANGLKVKAAMSIGHPGETPETVEATREWLKEVKPDDFDVTIITVYPGTPYYDDARESKPGIWTYEEKSNGDRLHAHHVDHLKDVNFYKGVPGDYHSYVYTDALSEQEICALRDDVEDDVRKTLGIPYPTAAAAKNYDHSMGMGPC